VVITALPISIVCFFFGAAKILRVYAKRQQTSAPPPETSTSLPLADFAVDVCFFVTFLTFPSYTYSQSKPGCWLLAWANSVAWHTSPKITVADLGRLQVQYKDVQVLRGVDV
jgi:hypothetical protein